jgi:hypothetical protein
MHPSTGDIARGQVVWTPPADARQRFVLGRYLDWLAAETGDDFAEYPDLYRWSVTDLEDFWSSVWRFFEIGADAPCERVLGSDQMPGPEWFPGARLNYAAHIVGRGRKCGRGRCPLPVARALRADLRPRDSAHADRHEARAFRKAHPTGTPVADVVSRDALASPALIEPFAAYAARRRITSNEEREHG